MAEEVFLYIFDIKSLLFFILGTAFGIALSIHVRNSEIKIKGNEKTLIVVIVAGAWLLSIIADMVVSAYETPTMIHTIMGIVVGYFFDFKFLNNGKKMNKIIKYIVISSDRLWIAFIFILPFLVLLLLGKLNICIFHYFFGIMIAVFFDFKFLNNGKKNER